MANSTSFTTWSDVALIDETKRLVAAERGATAALVRALMEIDARKLYLGEGCPSLFTYCTEVLHLAEGAAYNRIEAARASRRFPQLLASLEAGDLTLTTVRLLSKHLSADNVEAVMAAARHKSKRELEVLAASLNPGPPVPTAIRKLPPPRLPSASVAAAAPLAGAARSSAVKVDVRRRPLLNSITWSRTPPAEGRPWRTSSFAVGPTTPMRHDCSSELNSFGSDQSLSD